ncbi:MAG: TlpA family protein disulfide reductase [Flavobacteriaceae bacterium]|nr:TlpA family protein disulfide reductase [Flavobacteriaceae bacterium]
MKNILISGAFIISSVLQAQFTFKGTITDYPNKRVVVKLDRAFDELLVGTVTTNSSGFFSLPVKEKYTGIIEISLPDAKKGSVFISDNTDIDFTASISNGADDGFILYNPGNSINKAYQEYLNYELKKSSILPQLQSILNIYTPSDDFYSSLKKEIQTISGLNPPDLSKYPFLSYYISALELVKNSDSDSGSGSIKNDIIDHLKNSGEEFETAGLGRALLYNYLRQSFSGVSSRTDWENNVDNAIEILLKEVGEDTDRGQETLSAVINFLNGYGITKLADKYMNKAESLTCSINPELKETITRNNSIKEGKIIPDIKFTHKLNGKYSSLYDIKTKYKLILVWASWCAHCKQEKPFVKQFYENFKKSGGEIIALAIDNDKALWEDFIKDTSWLNDSDLLYWDSKYVKELNITGTPTLFLVDQNNKILKITAKISDINSLIE